MRVGDVVVSTRGHDMGEWYVVKEVVGEFAYLIDGNLKPISKPKKKKIKHILNTNQNASEVAQKLTLGQYLQDAEVRKALKFFKNNFRSE